MTQKCSRCSCETNDHRILWLSCYYKLPELNIPFTPYTLYDLSGNGPTDHSNTNWLSEEENVRQIHRDAKSFFTLLLCVDCRDSFMLNIQSWFSEKQPRVRREPKPWSDKEI